MVVPPPGGAGVCGGSDREWMYESVGYNVCLLVLSAAEHSPRARSFDLEVTPWAPTRLTSCIFHPGPTEAYEPLRSTLCPARTPFRDLAAPESAHMPPVQVRHFPGQKLRLGGDALGADPTYLLYLPSRSRGELRRIDFGAWPRAATSNHICLMQVGGSWLSPHLSRVAGHLSGRVGAH